MLDEDLVLVTPPPSGDSTWQCLEGFSLFYFWGDWRQGLKHARQVLYCKAPVLALGHSFHSWSERGDASAQAKSPLMSV